MMQTEFKSWVQKEIKKITLKEIIDWSLKLISQIWNIFIYITSTF